MRKTMLLSLTLVAALSLTVLAATGDRLPGDFAGSVWVQFGPARRWFGLVEAPIGWLNEVRIVAFGAMAGLVLITRGRWVEAIGFVPALSTIILVPMLRQFISRPMPSADYVHVLPSEQSASYPSGHVFLAVAVFGAMWHYAAEICGPHQWAIRLFRAAMILGMLDMGISRIYRGAHWPSDVLGAYLIGGLALVGAIRMYERVAAPVVERCLWRMGIVALPGLGSSGREEHP